MECQWIRNHSSALNAVLIGIIIALFSYFIDFGLNPQTKSYYIICICIYIFDIFCL